MIVWRSFVYVKKNTDVDQVYNKLENRAPRKTDTRKADMEEWL